MPAEEPIEEAEVVAEETHALPAVRAHEAMVARAEVSVEDVVAQRDKIVAVQRAVMKEGVHYGTIPGVKKPSLFKPGAEVLCTTFRFAPSFERHIDWIDDGKTRHLIVTSTCTLTHAPSGIVLGSAGGLCSTLESKYAYRQAEKLCPDCQQPLRKSKQKPEWYCWAKQGGCGSTFPLDHPSIESQTVGRIDNPDLADTYNTVLKMSDKRALVAAILVCTAASDVFTQDVEDNAATATAAATSSRGDESAAGDPLRKMRLDVSDLFRKIDRKRKVEGGVTFAEADEVLTAWFGDDRPAWDELDEEQTIRLGTALGGYFAWLTSEEAQERPKTFAEWQATSGDDIPF